MPRPPAAQTPRGTFWIHRSLLPALLREVPAVLPAAFGALESACPIDRHPVRSTAEQVVEEMHDPVHAFEASGAVSRRAWIALSVTALSSSQTGTDRTA